MKDRWLTCVLIAGLAVGGAVGCNDASMAAPSGSRLTFDTATQDRIEAIYVTDRLTLVMRAWVEGDQIRSEIARADGVVITSLQIPNTGSVRDEAIPGAIEIGSSATTAALSKLALSAEELGALQADVRAGVDEIYVETPNIQGQMRLVLGYQSSILGVVQPATDGRSSIYQPTGGGTPCTEEAYDPSIPFHYQEDHPGGALARAGGPIEDQELARVDGPEEATACLLGQASSRGCCGNYSGCCYYWHPVCYAHDVICSSCDHWYCGWQCKPD